MLLTKELPVALEVNGKEYPVQTDFRKVLKYESRMKKGASDIEIARAVDEMFNHEDEIITIRNFSEAVSRLNWFVSCGETKSKRLPSAALGINGNKPFDFEVDGVLIYSAFIQTYGIDLLDTEYMHWWKFNALLADVSRDIGRRIPEKGF